MQTEFLKLNLEQGITGILFLFLIAFICWKSINYIIPLISNESKITELASSISELALEVKKSNELNSELLHKHELRMENHGVRIVNLEKKVFKNKD